MAAGTLVIDNIENGLGDVGKTTDMIFGSAKAWVNFNGSGTVAIADSFNVSSITDLGVGNYTVNFATNFSNIDYCVLGGTAHWSGTAVNVGSVLYDGGSKAVGSHRIQTIRMSDSSVFDSTAVYMACFGN